MNKLLNIEFLRGFAVILVFFFHYNQKLFGFFFVGVDIFFLLSGFVITTSIYSKNEFNFFNFLLRRIKRIYPALIFTLILFFIYYFLFYKNYIDDYENNFFSIIFTILGLSNFYYSTNVSLFYFNQEIRWLIHTWSLSVEIQFYILVALISSFFFSKRFNIKIYAKYFFFIISIISFLLFIFTDIKYISDYYSLPGRLWEFSLGSCLYFLKKEKKLNFNIGINSFLIILIFLNFFSLNYKLIITFSIISIFFILVFSDIFNKNILTNFILYYGKISYSFYLWHLILISFLKNSFQNGILDFLFIFLITTALSHISYKLIEVNFNKKSNIDSKLEKLIKYFFYILLIFLIYVATIDKKIIQSTWNKIFQDSFFLSKFLQENRFIDAEKNLKIFLPRYDDCVKSYENFSWSTRVNCLKDESENFIVYLFGNSYAEHLTPVLFSIPNISLMHSRFENSFLDDHKDLNINLDQIALQYDQITKKYNTKIIIISVNGRNYSDKSIENLLSKFKENYTKIILLYPHPNIEEFKNKKLLNVYRLNKKKNLLQLNKFNKIEIFDTFKSLCDNCTLEDYSKFFINESHLNLNGSLRLYKDLEKIIKTTPISN